MAEALAFILLSVLVAIVFESNLLVPGMLTVNAEVMYNVMMFMELVTICAIPVALKMFSIKFIRRRLSAEGSHIEVILLQGLRLSFHARSLSILQRLWLQVLQQDIL